MNLCRILAKKLNGFLITVEEGILFMIFINWPWPPAVYHFWRERNGRIFKNQSTDRGCVIAGIRIVLCVDWQICANVFASG